MRVLAIILLCIILIGVSLHEYQKYQWNNKLIDINKDTISLQDHSHITPETTYDTSSEELQLTFPDEKDTINRSFLRPILPPKHITRDTAKNRLTFNPKNWKWRIRDHNNFLFKNDGEGMYIGPSPFEENVSTGKEDIDVPRLKDRIIDHIDSCEAYFYHHWPVDKRSQLTQFTIDTTGRYVLDTVKVNIMHSWHVYWDSIYPQHERWKSGINL